MSGKSSLDEMTSEQARTMLRALPGVMSRAEALTYIAEAYEPEPGDKRKAHDVTNTFVVSLLGPDPSHGMLVVPVKLDQSLVDSGQPAVQSGQPPPPPTDGVGVSEVAPESSEKTEKTKKKPKKSGDKA